MATVYSYSRFSCSNQDATESLRRQTAILDSWLKRHPEHTLDETLVLKDCAKTAFKSKGKHISLEDRSKLDPKERTKLDRQGTNLDPNKGDLGLFIEMAKRGEIPRGSILAVEDLDRFSRTPPSVAYEAFVELVETGVRILTLSPEIMVDQKNMNEMHVTFPIMTKIQLSHDESLKKSDRIKASWESRRQAARAGSKKSVGNYPSWLRPTDDGFEIIEEKAKIVRAIFDLSDKHGIGGHGIQRMLEGTPRFSKRLENDESHQQWNNDSTITNLLRNKAAIGIYQPNAMRNGKWEPEGEPIHNFFPSVVSDEQFYRVQLGLDRRRKNCVAAAKENNLFTGILKNLHGESWRIQFNRYWSDNGGSTPQVSVVEEMMFAFIKQLKIPANVSNEGALLTLRSELEEVNKKIREVSDHMERASDITSYFGVLDKLQVKRRELLGKIEYCVPHYDPALSLKTVQQLVKQIEGVSKKEVASARIQLKLRISELIDGIVMSTSKVDGSYRENHLTVSLKPSIFGVESQKEVFGVSRHGKLIDVSFEQKEGHAAEVMVAKEKELKEKHVLAYPKKERAKKLTKSDIARMFELSKQGMTQVELGRLFGCTQAHVSWSMKNNSVISK